MTPAMIPQPAIDVAIRVTVLLLTAVAIERLVRSRTSAAVRHLLWTGAVIGALVLPFFTWSLPPLRVAVTTRQVASPVPHADRARDASTLASSDEANPSRLAATTTRVVDSAPRVRSALTARMLIVLLYGAGVLIVLARILRDQLAVRRLLDDSIGEPTEDVNTGTIPIRIARDDCPPLTVGLGRPTIILPRDAAAWSAERRSAVLSHELAHVERHDCATQLVAAIACAVYWPHPLIWLAAARMRFERELACDDAVLARGMAATDYATHLLDIARGLSTRRVPLVAVAMAAPSHLERRLRAVLEADRPRLALRRKAVLAACACVAALVIPLSSVTATTRVERIVTKGQSTPLTQSVTAAHPAQRVLAANVAAEMPARPTKPSAAAPGAAVAPTLRGQFNVWLNTDRSTEREAVIHLTVFMPGSLGIIGTDYPLSRFDGLSADQLREPDARLHFRLTADAGVIDFAGVMQGNDGNGAFEFRADSAYGAALRRRGVNIRESEQIGLALAGRPASAVANRSALDGAPATTAHETRDDVRDGQQSARPERPSPLDGTWRASPGPGNTIRLDIEWSDVNQWARLVDAAELTPIAGGFVYRADAGEIAFTGDLRDRRGSGSMLFSPNRDFADTLQRLGVRGLGTVSTHDLKNLAFYGMNAATIREFMALGVGPIDKGGLLAMAIFGVTPDFARRVRDAGERDLAPENLVSLKHGGRRR